MPDGGSGDVVAPAEVLAALDRVLASTAFARAPRSRDFLAYVVTETLAGRGDRISERTVGRSALGRDADFDGRTTASVRVRATRVRQELERYYAYDGRDEPVRITIPPGRYVAVFDRTPEPAGPVDTAPGVAVIAFASAGGPQAAAVAASVSDHLTTRLCQYVHIRVVGPTSMIGDPRSTGAALGVSNVLDGLVVERGDDIRVSVRLTTAGTDEVVWSDEHVFDASALGGLAAEDAWASQIAARLGDMTGVVVRQELVRAEPRRTDVQSAARLAFFTYADRGTVESLLGAAELLDRALGEGDRPADLLSMRAAIANAAQAFGVSDREDSWTLASSLAREALTVDGTNAHAHLVLGSVAHYRGEWELAIEHAETAVSLAPQHPTYLVAAAGTLCGSGRWERGTALIHEAHRLNPGLTGRTHTWLAAGHLVAADHARALGEASHLPASGGFVWGPLYRAMALAGLGHLDLARSEMAVVAEMRPEIVEEPESFFVGQMRLTPEQRDHLVDLARRATA
ncbi:MAG: hypothetical protein U0S36_04650 [Candidatus Nanopelagicales bacterium]|jgi:adenylate cyclase